MPSCARWRDEDARRGALEAALRLLSYRPRSEQELRRRLEAEGLRRSAPVDEALARLRELGYVNDAAFARFYTETQQASRPRSQRLLTGELRRRGIEAEHRRGGDGGVSDEEAAYAAAAPTAAIAARAGVPALPRAAGRVPDPTRLQLRRGPADD